MTVAHPTNSPDVNLTGPKGARGPLARSLASAVDAVGGVRRSGGSGVEVATQYRGGRVIGVRLADHEVTVQVIAERLPLGPLTEKVHAAARTALLAAGDDRSVRVIVDDLDLTCRLWAPS